MLQGANYLIPLLTLPYLVRVLGVEYFGLLAFATATNAYFLLVTDYGFNLSATRQISVNREDRHKVQDIFSSVLTIKFIMMLTSLFVLVVAVYSIDKLRADWEVYALTFGMVVGQALFPVWFFQGMERMKYVALLNIGTKIIFTACIFLFVNTKEDYYLVPLINSSGYIFMGVYSLYIISKDYGIKFKIQEKKSIIYQLKEGWYIFYSSMAISFYTISVTFLLGLLTNNKTVGYYSAAENIIKAVHALYAPVSQSLYPFLSKVIDSSKSKGIYVIRRVLLLLGSVMLVVSSIVFILSEQIVLLILGAQYSDSIVIVKILAFLPFIVVLSNIFGIQTMLNFDLKVAFSRILSAAAVLGVILSLLLIPVYHGEGAAATILIVETFVSIVMFVYLQMNNIKVVVFKRDRCG